MILNPGVQYIKPRLSSFLPLQSAHAPFSSKLIKVCNALKQEKWKIVAKWNVLNFFSVTSVNQHAPGFFSIDIVATKSTAELY